ncbi:MAG: hypothetical protein RL094_599 [Candidatus Parcubacteria bacterium]|jgi:hypothetical protein
MAEKKKGDKPKEKDKKPAKTGSGWTTFIVLLIVILLIVLGGMLIWGSIEDKMGGRSSVATHENATATNSGGSVQKNLLSYVDNGRKTPTDTATEARTITIKPGTGATERTRVRIPLNYRIEWSGPKGKPIYVTGENFATITDSNTPGEYHKTPEGRWVEFSSGTGHEEEVDISFTPINK